MTRCTNYTVITWTEQFHILCSWFPKQCHFVLRTLLSRRKLSNNKVWLHSAHAKSTLWKSVQITSWQKSGGGLENLNCLLTMTNGILRPRTQQVFTDPQSEDKTAQCSGSGTRQQEYLSFQTNVFLPPCHFKSANGCKWGTAECQAPWPGTSAFTENIAENSPKKIILGMAGLQQCAKNIETDPINLYNPYITLNEYIWTEISTASSRQFALFLREFLQNVLNTNLFPVGG